MGEVSISVDADGKHPGRLTSATADDRWPAWSPDGKKIAFQSNRDGNFEIYVLSVQNEELQRGPATQESGTI